jgi:integrase
MSAAKGTPSAAIVVRVGPTGTPFYEAKWRVDGAQVKRRLGPAWVERHGDGWRKRPGRAPTGSLDPRSVHVAAAEAVASDLTTRQRAATEAAAAAVVTVRDLADEWMRWLRDVRGARPSTLVDRGYLLREPGTPHKRGGGASEGRIMAAFGDRAIADVTTRDVSTFLQSLDGELTPRNVNKHRQILTSMFAHACREDTHALPANPASGTDKRREPPPAAIDHYEVEDIEALARVAEAGKHRAAANGRTQAAATDATEVVARAAEDAQDAALFRVLFYSGMRLGEALVLRWGDVTFTTDRPGAMLLIHRTLSAGVEVDTPKGGKARTVPLARPAAQALATLGRRGDFTGADEYVFANRLGRRLDPSAVRRRYQRACKVAGLRPLRLHALRHAAGSLTAQAAGAAFARDLLGHSDVRTTNRYLHGKVDARALRVVDAAFGVEDEETAAAALPAR